MVHEKKGNARLEAGEVEEVVVASIAAAVKGNGALGGCRNFRPRPRRHDEPTTDGNERSNA